MPSFSHQIVQIPSILGSMQLLCFSCLTAAGRQKGIKSQSFKSANIMLYCCKVSCFTLTDHGSTKAPFINDHTLGSNTTHTLDNYTQTCFCWDYWWSNTTHIVGYNYALLATQLPLTMQTWGYRLNGLQRAIYILRCTQWIRARWTLSGMVGSYMQFTL